MSKLTSGLLHAYKSFPMGVSYLFIIVVEPIYRGYLSRIRDGDYIWSYANYSPILSVKLKILVKLVILPGPEQADKIGDCRKYWARNSFVFIPYAE
jgi:hypothetical protein